MNPYSTRLACAGVMIGTLALSATVFANSRPPGKTAASTTVELSRYRRADSLEAETDILAVMAPEPEPAGPFFASLRVEEPPPAGHLFLCDAAGCPLEELPTDCAETCSIGPLFPGKYTIWQSSEAIGSFRLLDNASLEDARGQLWTDGELLHLERFCPGTAVFTLHLSKTGYFSLSLHDENGSQRNQDLFIPDNTPPDQGGSYIRVVEFRGLAPGLYTAVRRQNPLTQLTVRAGERSETELIIEN